MLLLIFASSVFGIVFGVRIIQFFMHRKLVCASNLTKIGTVFLCFHFLISIFAFHLPILVFIGHSFLILTLWMILFLLERRQIDGVRARFLNFLDRWHLNLQIGQSVLRARESALHANDTYLARAIEAILSSKLNPNDRMREKLFPASTILALRSIERATHLSSERLEILRKHVRSVENFRRKSGRATAQARIQSITMLLMQVAVSLYIGCVYGWSRNIDLIVIGGLMSAFSLVWINKYSVRIIWPN